MREQILQQKFKLFAAITGGGTGFISDFVGRGGASDKLVGAYVPYSEEALKTWLIPNNVEKCVHKHTAGLLASQARKSIDWLGIKSDEPRIGIGATFALKKHNEREGRENKGFIVCIKDQLLTDYEIQFDTRYTREEQEEFASIYIMGVLAKALGLIDSVFDVIDYKRNHVTIG